MKKNTINKIIAGLVFTLIATFIIYRTSSTENLNLLQELYSVNYWLLGIAFLIQPVILAVKGYRYYYINPSNKLTESIHINTVATLLNSVLPFKLGELTYFNFSKRLSKTPYSKTLGNLITMRFADILSVFVFGGITYLVLIESRFLLVFSLLLVALIVIYFTLEKTFSICLLPFSRTGMGKKLAENMTVAMPFKKKINILLLTLVAWFLSGVGIWAILRSMHLDVSFIESLSLNSLTIFFQLIPNISFANIGVVQLGWYSLIKLFNLGDNSVALLSGIYVHIVSLVCNVVYGSISFVCLKILNKKHSISNHP
jgi:uncharacterized membrane protein YbhN (UPF0104 family)